MDTDTNGKGGLYSAPVEILYLVDDYCAIEQHWTLKLVCHRFYQVLNGKGLKRLHIGRSLHDAVLKQYLSQCTCSTSTHCTGYGCRKRWLFLNPEKAVWEDVYHDPGAYRKLLSHISGLSVKFGEGQWAQELLRAILSHCSNIEQVEISYVGDKFNRSLWREAINCFYFMPNIDKADVRMYTTHCPRMFAEVLSRTIPNMKCFPLMILDSDLDHMGHPWFIKPFKMLQELEISLDIEPYNFITAEQMGSFLFSLPHLSQLKIFGSAVYNPRGVQWIPPNVGTLTIDSCFDPTIEGPRDCPGKSNGDALRHLTVYTITTHEAHTLDLSSVEQLKSYYDSDSVTDVLLNRLNPKCIKSVDITTDNPLYFSRQFQRLHTSLQSLTIQNGFNMSMDSLYRFIQMFARNPTVYPCLEFIYFNIQPDLSSIYFHSKLYQIFRDRQKFPHVQLYLTSSEHQQSSSFTEPVTNLIDPLGNAKASLLYPNICRLKLH
ncbi:hypothetical protein TRICI_003251 [Trichomonascus ciferrii]|uniref:F-box domain-containing protein n=1 Tax=Trichomonascus ciferrii TaxID=44093 RepID=A0A642V4A1_9ASCO|nr:hypothetical protein TRICI_003251 [Trichomonascus ciferrii]